MNFLPGLHKPLIALVLLLLVVLACGTSPNTVPTMDTNAMLTAVMNTAIVAISQTAMANVSIAESLPTNTPEPTETTIPLSTSTSRQTASGASCIPSNPPQTGKVVEVVDGDTIRVAIDGTGLIYSVRYIGMDTPENTSQVEYFGAEAEAKNLELVYGKPVTLIKDVSEADLYGRLLRYVIVDNLFINYELVAQGFANTASYPPDIACILTFQEAEQKASASKLGLWNAPPTSAPLPTQVAQPTQAVFPTQAPSGGGGGNAVCNCSGPDLNCGDFKPRSSAQACFNYCVSQGWGDVFGLDRDNDGLACEG